jgi:hypothetical protein
MSHEISGSGALIYENIFMVLAHRVELEELSNLFLLSTTHTEV